jgi:hypothetical protein
VDVAEGFLERLDPPPRGTCEVWVVEVVEDVQTSGIHHVVDQPADHLLVHSEIAHHTPGAYMMSA